jgi:hypothetical protein
MIICGPLVAIAIVAGSPGLDAREPLRDQSPEQLARRLIDASTIRVAVESAVPVSLGLIEKKGTEITPETRALIDRWFSDEHLDELLIPLYLRHLTPEAMAAAAEFYATEPGASFASKLVGLRTGTVPEPTAEPSPEAEDWRASSRRCGSKTSASERTRCTPTSRRRSRPASSPCP